VSAMSDLARSIVDTALARFGQGRGMTAFLVGSPGAGQGLVLDELARLLSEHGQPPVFLRGSLIDGTYVPSSQHGEPKHETLSSAVEMTASLAAFGGPVGTLLSQVLTGMNSAHSLARSLSRESPTPEGPRLLRSAIRALADQRPLCLAVESIGRAGAWWWLNLVEGLAIEAEVDLRLSMIVGIEAPPILPPEDDDEPALWRLARSLVNSGRAQWLTMPVLDATTVTPLVGPSTAEVREKLCAVTEGRAGWIVQLFEDWCRRSVVTRNRKDLWSFDYSMLSRGIGPTNDIVDGRVQEVLGEDRSAIGEAKRLLALGALQGETFSLEPVAGVLGVPVASCERLAERLTGAPGRAGLLERIAERAEEGLDDDQRPTRYRFVERMVLASLERYGLGETERCEAAAESAALLEGAHSSDPAPVASTLAALYAAAGKSAESRRWMKVAEMSSAGDLLRWQVKAAIEDERQWHRWSREQARRSAVFLLNAAEHLSRTEPLHELWYLLEAV
jgi:hypothetical protein